LASRATTGSRSRSPTTSARYLSPIFVSPCATCPLAGLTCERRRDVHGLSVCFDEISVLRVFLKIERFDQGRVRAWVVVHRIDICLSLMVIQTRVCSPVIISPSASLPWTECPPLSILSSFPPPPRFPSNGRDTSPGIPYNGQSGLHRRLCHRSRPPDPLPPLRILNIPSTAVCATTLLYDYALTFGEEVSTNPPTVLLSAT